MLIKEKMIVRGTAGSTLFDTIKEAISLSVGLGVPVEFSFNGRTILVDADSIAREIIPAQFYKNNPEDNAVSIVEGKS